MRVLFMDGQIMALRHSYTSQVMQFFKNPSVLFERSQAVLFVRPDPQDTAAVYEPLERVRAVVGNVLACLHAAVPKTGWHYAFSAFYLPSPLGTSRPGFGGLLPSLTLRKGGWWYGVCVCDVWCGVIWCGTGKVLLNLVTQCCMWQLCWG